MFSPDGSNIAYGDGPVVRVRDLKTDQQVCTFENHTKAVTSVAYTPDGKYLLSGAYDKTARLWDAKTGNRFSNTAMQTRPSSRSPFLPVVTFLLWRDMTKSLGLLGSG